MDGWLIGFISLASPWVWGGLKWLSLLIVVSMVLMPISLAIGKVTDKLNEALHAILQIKYACEDVKTLMERMASDLETIKDDVCSQLVDVNSKLGEIGKGTVLANLEMEAEKISTHLNLILDEIENRGTDDEP